MQIEDLLMFKVNHKLKSLPFSHLIHGSGAEPGAAIRKEQWATHNKTFNVKEKETHKVFDIKNH
jgi:hypothetical protein